MAEPQAPLCSARLGVMTAEPQDTFVLAACAEAEGDSGIQPCQPLASRWRSNKSGRFTEGRCCLTVGGNKFVGEDSYSPSGSTLSGVLSKIPVP